MTYVNRNANKTRYAPGSNTVSSWMGIDYEHRWLLRKMFEAGALFYLGDMISQWYILWRFRRALDAKNKHLDGPSKLQSRFWRTVAEDWSGIRSLRSGLFGLMFYGPLRVRWGRGLEKVLPFHSPTGAFTPGLKADYNALAGRMGMEYLVWLPTALVVNLFYSSFCDGRPGDITFKAGNVFPLLYFHSICLFLPFQALCFFVLPAWTWTMTTNIATCYWAGMLAYHNFKAQQLLFKGKVLPITNTRI